MAGAIFRAPGVLCGPVFKQKIRYPFKFPGVMADQNTIMCQHCSGDDKIVGTDDHPILFKMCPNKRVFPGGLMIKGDNFKGGKEFFPHFAGYLGAFSTPVNISASTIEGILILVGEVAVNFLLSGGYRFCK